MTASAAPTLGALFGSWTIGIMQALPWLRTCALTEEVSWLKVWAAKTKSAEVRDELRLLRTASEHCALTDS